MFNIETRAEIADNLKESKNQLSAKKTWHVAVVPHHGVTF
jgi:hypothetical protein